MSTQPLWVALLEILAGGTNLAANWLVQSTLVIAIGLTAGRIARQRGPAMQSAIYRTTLFVALVAPLAAWLLASAGVSVALLSISLPRLAVVDATLPPMVSIDAVPSEVAEPELPSAAVATLPTFQTESPGAVTRDPFDQSGRTFPNRQGFDFANNSAIRSAPFVEQSAEAPLEVLVDALPDVPLEPEPLATLPAWTLRIGSALAASLVVSLWLIISGVMLTRLVLSHWRLRYVRRTAVAVDDADQMICNRLAAELGVWPLPLLRTPFMASPCLTGIARPVILLPEDFTRTPLAAVLIHELAHLTRRDCAWHLLRELATAVLFFQPLLWRLARLLETTAEEVCDDYVVQHVGDRQGYATTLVTLAEHAMLPTSGAVALITLRSLLGQRVTRILDSTRRLSLTVSLSALCLILAVGLVTTLVAGLVATSQPEIATNDELPAIEEFDVAEESIETDSIVELSEKPLADIELQYQGQVLDPDGKPVVGARLWMFDDPGEELLHDSETPIAVSGPDGRFEFRRRVRELDPAGNGRWKSAYLVAAAPGFGYIDQWALEFESTGDANPHLRDAEVDRWKKRRPVLQLVRDDAPIEGQVLSLEGLPIAGATICASEVWRSETENLDALERLNGTLIEGFANIAAIAPHWLVGRHLPQIVPAVITDANGQFKLRGIGRERIAELVLSAPHCQSARLLCRTRSGGQIVTKYGSNRSSLKRPYDVEQLDRTVEPARYMQFVRIVDRNVRHLALPSRTVMGRVVDANSGQPLAGMLIEAGQTEDSDYKVDPANLRAVSDATGEFTLDGLPLGQQHRRDLEIPGGQLRITPPPGSDYVAMLAPYTIPIGSGDFALDLPMVRGLRASGNVTDDAGEPVAGTVQFAVTVKLAPMIKVVHLVQPVETDATGNFTLSVPADGGVLCFSAHDRKLYPTDERYDLGDSSKRLIVVTGSTTGAGITGGGLYPSGNWFQTIDPTTEKQPLEFNIRLRRRPGERGAAAMLPPVAAREANPRDEMPASSMDAPAPSPIDPSVELQYRGQVLDPIGKPVAGARVFYSYFSLAADNLTLDQQRAETDAEGWFSFSVQAADLQVDALAEPYLFAEILATHPGFGFAAGLAIDFEASGVTRQKYLALPQRQRMGSPTPSDAVLRLTDDLPVTGQVVSLEGLPVPGVTVRVRNIHWNRDGNLDEFERAAQQPEATEYSAESKLPGYLRPSQRSAVIPPVTTDDEGRFTIAGLGQERLAALVFSGEKIETAESSVRTREAETFLLPRVADADSSSGRRTYSGHSFKHVAAPSTPVRGKITDIESGLPIAGARIIAVREGSYLGNENEYVFADSDEAGNYELTGVPINRSAQLFVFSPPGSGYPTISTRVRIRANAESTTKDLVLRRGVLVRGTMIDGRTHKPVAGRIMYDSYRDNPHLADYPTVNRPHPLLDARVDTLGHFEITVLPGKGVLHFSAHDFDDYRRAQGVETLTGPVLNDNGSMKMFDTSPHYVVSHNAHFLQQIDIKPADTLVEMELNVASGGIVPGRVIAPDDAAVADIMLDGVVDYISLWRNSADGRFEIRAYYPDRPRDLFAVDHQRKLAGYTQLSGNPPDEVVIRLQPAGEIRGRLLNERGEALAGVTLYGIGASGKSADSNSKSQVTDDEGRFHIEFLAPDFKYSFIGQGESFNGPALHDVMVAPGEIKDLGDVTAITRMTPASEVADATDGQKAMPEPTPAHPPAKKHSSSAPAIDPSTVFQYRGTVVDPDGKPTPEAKLFWVNDSDHVIPIEDIVPHAALSAAGAFDFTVLAADLNRIGRKEWLHGRILATMPGVGFADKWSLQFETTGLAAGDAGPGLRSRCEQPDPVLRLVRDDVPITGQVLTLEGAPIAGATVVAWQVRHNEDESLRMWEESAREPQIALDRLLANVNMLATGPSLNRVVAEVVTDANGLFTLAGVGRDRMVELIITGPTIEAERVFARTRVGERVMANAAMYFRSSPTVAIHDRTIKHFAASSQPLCGRITDADTNEPIAGARVSPGETDPYSSFDRSHIAAVTDADGNYQLLGLPMAGERAPNSNNSRNRLYVFPPAASRYLPTSVDFTLTLDAAEKPLPLQLRAGVRLSGVVTDDHGKPVSGVVRYGAMADNPHLPLFPRFSLVLEPGNFGPVETLKDDGRFNLVVLPGPGLLTFSAHDSDKFRTEAGIDRITYPKNPAGLPFNTVPPNFGGFETPNLYHQLEPTLDAKLVDLSLRVERNAVAGVEPNAVSPRASATLDAPPTAMRKETPAPATTATDQSLDPTTVFHYRGTVVDADGKPAAGANLFWVDDSDQVIPIEKVNPRAALSAAGAFDFTVSAADLNRIGRKEWVHGRILAALPGFGFADKWSLQFETTGSAAGDAGPGLRSRSEMLDPVLRLVRDDVPITGQVLTLEGAPVAGASVTVLQVRHNERESLDLWETIARAPTVTLDRLLSNVNLWTKVPSLSRVVAEVVTDSKGMFTLVGIGRDRMVELLITSPTIETERIFARTRVGERIVAGTKELSLTQTSVVIHDRTVKHVAAPSRPLRGRITDAETNQPIAEARVSLGESDRYSNFDRSYIFAISDANGDFLLSGLPLTAAKPARDEANAPSRLYVLPPAGSRYLSVTIPFTFSIDAAEKQLPIQLRAGVLLSGIVKDGAGRPVPGAVKYGAMSHNSHLSLFPGYGLPGTRGPAAVVQDDGRFDMVVLPGAGLLTFTATDFPKFRTSVGLDRILYPREPRNTNFSTVPAQIGSVNTVHYFHQLEPALDAKQVEVRLLVERNPDVSEAPAENASEQRLQPTTLFRYRGHVVGPDDKPVPGVRLYWVTNLGEVLPIAKVSRQAQVAADGSFEFTTTVAQLNDLGRNQWLHGRILAAAPGFGFTDKWSVECETTGAGAWLQDAGLRDRLQQLNPILKLVPDDVPIVGQILTLEGVPVPGARVIARQVRRNDPEGLGPLNEAMKVPATSIEFLIYRVPFRVFGPQLTEFIAAAQTDASGSFTLRGIGRERFVELLVSGPGIEASRVKARTTVGEAVTLSFQSYSSLLGGNFMGGNEQPRVILYDRTVKHFAAPSRPIRGRIVDADTGLPIAGVRISAGVSEPYSFSSLDKSHVTTTTDAAGRYQLEGLSVGIKEMPINALGRQDRLYLTPPAGTRYLPVSFGLQTPADGADLTLDYQLRQGIVVQGRVLDAKRQPVSGVVEYFAATDNPHVPRFVGAFDGGGGFDFGATSPVRAQVTDEGRFTLPIIPGMGLLTFRAEDQSSYRLGSGRDQITLPKRPGSDDFFTTIPAFRNTNVNVLSQLELSADLQQTEVELQVDPPHIAADTPPVQGRIDGQMPAGAAMTKPEEVPAGAAVPAPVNSQYTPMDPNTELHYRGMVVDPDKKPVAGAKVYFMYRWEWMGYVSSERPRAVTAADGSFEFALKPVELKGSNETEFWLHGQIAATAAGFGIAAGPALDFDATGVARQRAINMPQFLKPAYNITGNRVLQLVPDRPLTGQILSIEGTPIANATVRVGEVRWNESGSLDAWEAAVPKTDGAGSFYNRLDMPQLPSMIADVRTNDQGRFTIAGLGRERIVGLIVSGERIELNLIHARTRDAETVSVSRVSFASTPPPNENYYGDNFKHVVAPSTPARGRVTDTDTGAPIPGVLLTVNRSFSMVRSSETDPFTTVTDAAGNYELLGLTLGKAEVVRILPPVGSTYLRRSESFPAMREGSALTKDVSLTRGVLVRGTVVDQRTGKPVSGQVEYAGLQDNPHVPDYTSGQHLASSGADGRFEIIVLPGSGVLGFVAANHTSFGYGQGVNSISAPITRDDFNYRRVSTAPTPMIVEGKHSLKQIEVPFGSEPLEVAIQIESGLTVPGRIVDADGKAVNKAMVYGMYAYSDGLWQGIVGGRFEILAYYDQGRRHLFAFDPVKNLAGYALLAGPPTGEVQIALGPSGALRGRLVNEKNEPLRQVQLTGLGICADPQWNDGKPLHTDAAGRFEIRGLVSGHRYDVYSRGNNVAGQVLFEVVVADGEIKDVGDVTPKAEQKGSGVGGQGSGKEAQTVDFQPPNTSLQPDSAADRIAVSGTVVDPTGKPVGGAEVTARRWYWQYRGPRLPLATTKTDASGRFEIAYHKSQFEVDNGGDNRWREAMIVATAPGFGPAMQTYNQIKEPGSATLQLVADRPITGRIMNLEGQPIAGAQLRVNRISTNEKNDFSPWIEAMRQGLPFFGMHELRGEQVMVPFFAEEPGWRTETDKDGRFEIAGCGANREIMLEVTGPGLMISSVTVINLPIEPFNVDRSQRGFVNKDIEKFYGVPFSFAVAPSAAIEGVVRDANSGEPLAGVLVIADAFAGTNLHGIRATESRTDAQGQYRIAGMPKGKGNMLLVMPNDEQPYFIRGIEVLDTTEVAERHLDIDMYRGVVITGRLLNKLTGKPVRGNAGYVPFPNNPGFVANKDIREHWDSQQSRYPTDAEGRFKVIGLPGRGFVEAICRQDPFPTGQGLDDVPDMPTPQTWAATVGIMGPTKDFPTISREINIPDTSTEHFADLLVDPGKSLSVNLVDSAGQPLSDVTLRGIWPRAQDYQARTGGPQVDVLGISSSEKRRLLFYSKERNLGQALEVTAADDGETKTVTLEPCATVTARLLDGDGEPVRGTEIQFWPNGERNFSAQLPGTITDLDGRFTFRNLVPGCSYTIGCGVPQHRLDGIARDLKVSAGETIDLGEFDVTKKERPEPVRKGSKAQVSGVGDQGSEEKVSGVGGQGSGKAMNSSDLQPPASSLQPNPDSVVVRGTVLDPAGKPVAGAEVTARRWYWDYRGPRLPLATTKTDAGGRFEVVYDKSHFEVDNARPNMWREAMIVATAPGFGPALQNYTHIKDPNQATLQLVPDRAIAGRIVNLEGQPVAAAQVRIRSLSTNQENDFSKWIAAMRAGLPFFGNHELQGERVSASFYAAEAGWRTETDKDGRFQLTGCGENREVMLEVTGPNIMISTIQLINAPVDPFNVDRTQQGFPKMIDKYYGSTFTFAAHPSAPIEGVVRDVKTGEPLVGVVVIGDKFAGTDMSGIRATETRTDSQGRYRVEGMPKGKGNQLQLLPSDDQPYFMRDIEVPDTTDVAEQHLDIPMYRGVVITGRLLNKVTGEPVKGYAAYVPFPDNPGFVNNKEIRDHWFSQQSRYPADAEGRFKVIGLPGRGFVAAICRQDPFPTGQGVDDVPDMPSPQTWAMTVGIIGPTKDFPTISREFTIPDDAIEHSADLLVDPGKSLRVNLVDGAGQPLSEVSLRGTWPRLNDYAVRTGGPSVEVLGISPNEKRRLLFYSKERNLGQALEVTAANDGETKTVTLETCATVTARLLDGDGELVRGAEITIYPSGENNFAVGLTGTSTDTDGRFTYAGLLPGCAYSIGCGAPHIRAEAVARDLAVTAGEIIDLGEFDVTKKERPEPKRKASGGEEKVSGVGGQGSEEKVSGVGGQDSGNELTASDLKPAASSLPPDADNIVVRGRVVDLEGKPVAGAKIVRWLFERDNSQAGKIEDLVESGSDGAFQIALKKPAGFGWNELAAIKPGYGIDWIEKSQLENGESLFRLPAENPIVGKVLTAEGIPVAGARVFCEQIRKPTATLDAMLPALLKDFDDTLYTMSRSFSADKIVGVVVSDAQGEFKLSGVGTDRIAQLNVKAAGLANQRMTIVVRDGFDARLYIDAVKAPIAMGMRPDFDFVLFGPRPTVILAPELIFEGVVRDRETSAAVVGCNVGVGGYGNFEDSITDSEGRYRVAGIARGRSDYRLSVWQSGEPKYLDRFLAISESPTSGPMRKDVELDRATVVNVRVLDRKTGKPVDATVTYLPLTDNEFLKSHPELPPDSLDFTRTTEQEPGQKRLHTIPGMAAIMAQQSGLQSLNGAKFSPYKTFVPEDADKWRFRPDISRDSWYLTGADGRIEMMSTENAVKIVNIVEDEENSVDLFVDSGELAKVRVLDPEGQPLNGAWISGMTAHWPIAFQLTESEAIVYALDPAKSRTLAFFHPQRNLAGTVVVRGDESEPVAVRLAPLASVTGQVLDATGTPLAEAEVSLFASTGIVRELYRFAPLPSETMKADEEGRFEFRALVPGLKFDMNVRQGTRFLKTRGLGQLEVKPGETIALGAFDPTNATFAKLRDTPPVSQSETPAPAIMPAPGAMQPAAPNAATPPMEKDTNNKGMGVAEFIAGKVVNAESGEPIAGVRVFELRPASDSGYSVQGIATTLGETAADGTFRVRAPRADRYDRQSLVASKDGFGIDWIRGDALNEPGEKVLRLTKDHAITGRVLTAEGLPVVGAKVACAAVYESPVKFEDFLETWQKKWRDGMSQVRKATYFENVLPAVGTDAAGQFELRGAGGDRLVRLRISAPGIATTERLVVTRAGFDEHRHDEHAAARMAELPYVSMNDRLFSLPLNVVTDPEVVAEGIVRDAETKLPVANCEVTSFTIQGSPLLAHTDANGHFRMAGMSSQKDGYHFGASAKSYLAASARLGEPTVDKRISLEIELSRGTVVKGRIVDRATGQGVSGAVRFAPLSDNKYYGTKPGYNNYDSDRTMASTEPDGTFELLTIPGRSVALVQLHTSEKFHDERISHYRNAVPEAADRALFALDKDDGTWSIATASGGSEFLRIENAAKIIDVPETGELQFELFVDRGLTQTLKIEDADGHPLTDTWVAGLTEHWPVTYLVPEAETTVYALSADDPRSIALYNAARNIGCLVTVRGDETAPVVARLMPLGSAQGQFFDDAGNPMADVEVVLNPTSMTDSELYRFVPILEKKQSIMTDAEGRFTLRDIIPGMKFTIFGRQERDHFYVKPRTGPITVESGQTLDLAKRVLTTAPQADQPAVPPEVVEFQVDTQTESPR